jgi:polysaccharide lyase-like protein
MKYEYFEGTVFVISPETPDERISIEQMLKDAETPPTPAEAPDMVWSFEDDNGGPWNKDFSGMRAVGSQKLPPDPKRFQIVTSPTRHGTKALKCTTNGNDIGISGAGSRERADVKADVETVGAVIGKEQWWAFSMRFDANFVWPRVNWGNHCLFDFHHLGADATGQAPINFELYKDGTTGAIKWRFRQYGGKKEANEFRQDLKGGAAPQREVWYDFVMRVLWNFTSAGQTEVWMRQGDEAVYTKQITRLAHPNCYEGFAINFQAANYHDPLGVPCSVYHDRIMRGRTPYSVAMADLEGVPRP